MEDIEHDASKQQEERPPQHQAQPGQEGQMIPEPIFIRDDYVGSGKLDEKVALITGGDSGIGRSVAVHFAREGADVAVAYYEEHEDAQETQDLVEDEGQECLLLAGDIGDESFSPEAIDQTLSRFGQLDILVNNAAEQHSRTNLQDISAEQLKRTFRTNFFGFFYLTKAALEHMEPGSVILNSTSVTAYRGSSHLIDYASTKGAIVAFTRSLATSLVDRNIRVNGVAPGPIWTPLIPATMSSEHVQEFGEDTPMKRAGQPAEVGPCYVFLASADASYMTGQIVHPNGGDFIST